MNAIKRYGTTLRIFDAGDKVADRYTIVPPRHAAKHYKPGRYWEAIACNAHPFHPLGFGQHCEVSAGPHLGKRIAWNALPLDAQKFARQSFPEFAPTTKTGYLKKDRQERFNNKRGWHVNAWRIVDAQGVDMVQPWNNTKTEARATAKQLGIKLQE